ncbi:hypothetical protein CF326_g2408, partial [Tilletia indica]
NSIPTLDQVKDKINAAISSPLELLRTDVNNTINAFQFDRSVLAVPPLPSTALQVCNSTTIAAATTPLDELAHAVHELETFLLLALLFAMLLVGLCTVGLEWCAWRSMWRHVRLIRDVCGREKGESIDVPESEKQKAAEAEKMEASDDQVDLDNGHDDTVAHRRALESYRSLTFRISAALDGRRIAACPTDDLKGLMGAAAESPFRKTLLSEAIGASSGRKLVSYQEKTRARLTDSRALFFNNINPLLLVFDPFLHSVNYVRSRSAFLTTVIISLAARFVDTNRDAALAVSLEHLWLGKQLPLILAGGYKSVEISQAFIILAMFHKPTRSLADDRSWQYLGFAIRIATEIGVNRRINPKESVKSKEQVRRRVRNRERLWCNLFLCDRIMSAQTGRPWTISDDLLMPEASADWHTQDFALPFDTVVVSMIRLRRTIARHSTELDSHLAKEHLSLDKDSSALSYLEFLRHGANTDLVRWRDSWSETSNNVEPESADLGPFSTHWTPLSKLYHQHSWLHLNSFVLQSLEKHETVSSSVYKDCWTAALELIKITLQLGEAKLMYAPNHIIVMAVYAAVSLLRLLNRDKSKHPWVNRDEAITAVRELIKTLSNAGKTPQHRNGAAVPYAKYLTSVLALWDPPSKEQVEENKKSKDPPRASSPNRLRSVSDAAAIRMRPRGEMASASSNAIVMPTMAEGRDRKAERNSLGSNRLLPSSAMLSSTMTHSPARPFTSQAVPSFPSMAFSSLPLGTPEASTLTPGHPQTHPHPHPINVDSIEAWAGGLNALAIPSTPTGDPFGLNQSASAPITALSTPGLGADTSGDLSNGGIDMNAAVNSAGPGMAAASNASGLGPPFLGYDMGTVSGLNMAGVKFPYDGRPPFPFGTVAPSTSSIAAAGPSSVGPTMMRAPHQQRHVSGGHTMPTSYVQSDRASAGGRNAGNSNAVRMAPPGEAFLDDANWTLPAAEMDGAMPTEGGLADGSEHDRIWDYLTSWDGSNAGISSGFWPAHQASSNFTSY